MRRQAGSQVQDFSFRECSIISKILLMGKRRLADGEEIMKQECVGSACGGVGSVGGEFGVKDMAGRKNGEAKMIPFEYLAKKK